MAFRMMASKVGGMDGLSSRGAGGWSRTCLEATATGVSPEERRATGDHLEEHDAERVDVAAGVDADALGLLGGEVGGRAHDRTGLGQALLGVDGPGDAEVGDLHLALVGDQHVARLHVAVDDPVLVGVAEGGGHVGADVGGPLGRQRPGRLAGWRTGGGRR